MSDAVAETAVDFAAQVVKFLNNLEVSPKTRDAITFAVVGTICVATIVSVCAKYGKNISLKVGVFALSVSD